MKDPKKRASIETLLNHGAVTMQYTELTSLADMISGESARGGSCSSLKSTNNNQIKPASVYYTPEPMEVDSTSLQLNKAGPSAKRYRESPILPRKRRDNPNLPLYIIKFIDNQSYVGKTIYKISEIDGVFFRSWVPDVEWRCRAVESWRIPSTRTRARSLARHTIQGREVDANTRLVFSRKS